MDLLKYLAMRFLKYLSFGLNSPIHGVLLALQRALRILRSEFGPDHIPLADVIMSIDMVYRLLQLE